MALALESALRLQPETVRRFLDAAVISDQPTTATLVAAGVPHYEANRLFRQLQAAGELVGGAWDGQARDGYRRLLAPSACASACASASASASITTASVTVRKLDRLHEGERPREKALHSGIQTLSDTELLALLLRTGGDEGVLEFADRLLLEHDGLLGLSRCELGTLLESRGVGPARATELAAAFELANRVASSTRRRERPRLTSPEAAVGHLRELVLLDHERFWCLPLDARSGLIGEPRQISQGDVDGTDAGPRSFFRAALAAGATSCLAVHNHPTGDPTPSPADLAVTTRLVAAGRTLDVKLVDHLIIGDQGRFISIRRNHPECFR